MMKKGDVWISAVLYITLGIIAITLILGAVMPLVSKIKEKNVVLQTKDILIKLDENIRTVAQEGPGSQRRLTLFMDKGELFFNTDSDNTYIHWSMETDSLLMEPDIVIKEGNIKQRLDTTFVRGVYDMNLYMNYTLNLNLTSDYNNPFKGKYGILIKHTGSYVSNAPIIEIQIT